MSIEAAAAESYENQQRTKETGLNSIPVFHQDENFRWLENILRPAKTNWPLTSLRAGRREKLLAAEML